MTAESAPQSGDSDSHEEAIDADLAEYAELTSQLPLSANFESRLFSKLDGTGEDLWRVGRVALLAFASAAAVALAFDLDSRSALDDAVLTQYDLVETDNDIEYEP